MIERERFDKVIKGLECCISGNPAICKRVGCPYAEEHVGIGDICIDHLMADAFALLKAQEPRAMTLGDLRDIGSVWELNTPPYLWMEINPTYRWTRGFWVAWREIYDMIDGLHPTYDADNYLKIWCCWTSRPTVDQRKNIPWNKANENK